MQRILEVETYRMMALLGLPLAEQSAPVLNAIEGELARLTATMVDADQSIAGAPESADDEQGLLRMITRLAARIEKLSWTAVIAFRRRRRISGWCGAPLRNCRKNASRAC